MAGENWSGQDLSDHDFSGQTLAGVNLSGCDLSDCDFSDCSISGVNFSGSNLSDADFRDSSISGSNFSGCDLEDADFTDAQIMGCNFRGANLDDAIGIAETNISSGTISYNSIGNVNTGSGISNNIASGNATRFGRGSYQSGNVSGGSIIMGSNGGSMNITSYTDRGTSHTDISLGKLQITSSRFPNHGVTSGGNIHRTNGIVDDRQVIDLNFVNGYARFENLGDGRTRVSLRLAQNGTIETVYEYIVGVGETHEIASWGIVVRINR
jgi:uncharacterized protein YjbI with pentapeptide repeats